MSNPSYRVWALGLDGATFSLIRPWVEAGHLPNFARLFKEGSVGDVRSTVPPITGPAWTSFLTGTNPGKHGIYDWVYRRNGSYDFIPVTAEHRQMPSFLSIASQAGKRVLSINVPMTYPPELVNGAIVSGLPATNLVTYPAQVAETIQAAVPGYIVYPDPGQAYSDQGVEAFLDRLDQAIQTRLALWQHMLAQEQWDLAMLVFNATDVVQHAAWKFMSPEHPLHHAGSPERFQNAILDIYRRMDRVLGDTMQSLPEDTVLLIMSDHGFGPLHKFIHVNTWLMREGLLHLRQTPLARFKSMLFRLGLSPMPIYDLLMRIGLGKLKREVVRGRGQGLLRTFFLSFDDVDWEKTQAYSYGNIGQIRINLRGREPQGCVLPEQYPALVTDITTRLTNLRDPATREQVVEHIYRREDIYRGEQLPQAPDILFLPKRLEYFGFGEYEFGDHRVIAALQRGISGTHRMNGIGMVWGKPIKPGALGTARLEDWAPTILHLMGLPIPAHMDGQPFVGILRPEAGLPPPVYGPAWENTQGQGSDTPGLSSEEEQIVRQRLKDLGYVS